MNQKLFKDIPIARFLIPHVLSLKNSNPRAIETNIARLKSNISKEIEKEPDGLIKDFGDIFTWYANIDYQELFNKTALEANGILSELYRKAPQTKMLYQLIKEVEEKVPYISLIIFARSGLLQNINGAMYAYSAYLDVDKYRGESRAVTILKYYASVVESVYKNYLCVIWDLTRIVIDKPLPKKYPDLGAMIKGILESKKLDEKIKSLVNPKAALYRNAGIHLRYRYMPETKGLSLWDENHPPELVLPKKLLKQATDMHILSTNYLWDIVGVYNRKIFWFDSGLGEIFHKNALKLKEQDDEAVLMVESKLQSLFKKANNNISQIQHKD